MKASIDTTFRNRVTSALADGTITDDGHTLFAPSFYSPHFTVEELTKARLVRTHKSDGTHKGSITASDGTPVASLAGVVYNLDFLYWVCRSLGIEKYPRTSGRGSQAYELVLFIRAELVD